MGREPKRTGWWREDPRLAGYVTVAVARAVTRASEKTIQTWARAKRVRAEKVYDAGVIVLVHLGDVQGQADRLAAKAADRAKRLAAAPARNSLVRAAWHDERAKELPTGDPLADVARTLSADRGPVAFTAADAAVLAARRARLEGVACSS